MTKINISERMDFGPGVIGKFNALARHCINEGTGTDHAGLAVRAGSNRERQKLEEAHHAGPVRYLALLNKAAGNPVQVHQPLHLGRVFTFRKKVEHVDSGQVNTHPFCETCSPQAVHHRLGSIPPHVSKVRQKRGDV